MDHSLELRRRVAVALECSVDDIGALVDEVGHDWLVHGTVPLDVSWSSVSISVDILVVPMIHWVLGRSPLAVRVGHWWVLWESSSQVPPKEIWVVLKSSLVESMIVGYQWSGVSQTSSKTL